MYDLVKDCIENYLQLQITDENINMESYNLQNGEKRYFRFHENWHCDHIECTIKILIPDIVLEYNINY